MIDVRFIKMRDVADLVRYACPFSGSIGIIYSKGMDGMQRFITIGEKIGKTRVVYYYDYDKTSNYVIYSAAGKETFSFVDKIGPDAGYQTYKMQVLHIKKDAFKASKSGKYNVSVVELTNYEEIVKGITSTGASSELMGIIYVFPHNGKKHIGVFGFFPDDDSLTFTHAEIHEAEGDYCFFKYDYNTGLITRTNGIQDGTGLYARIVNLAEPYAFLEDKKRQKNDINK